MLESGTPVNLHGVTIVGDFDLRAIGTVGDPLRCRECALEGSLVETDVVFERLVDLSGVRVAGGVELDGAVFDDALLLEEAGRGRAPGRPPREIHGTGEPGSGVDRRERGLHRRPVPGERLVRGRGFRRVGDLRPGDVRRGRGVHGGRRRLGTGRGDVRRLGGRLPRRYELRAVELRRERGLREPVFRGRGAFRERDLRWDGRLRADHLRSERRPRRVDLRPAGDSGSRRSRRPPRSWAFGRRARWTSAARGSSAARHCSA